MFGNRFEMKVTRLKVGLALVALSLLSAAPAGAQAVYNVTFNTSSVSGTPGYLDIEFNPGSGASQAATAQVLNFNPGGGTLTGAATLAGNVTGTLPGTLTFQNSTAINDYVQGFTYGTQVSFVLVLSGPAITSPNGSPDGSSFSVSFYDSSLNSILTNPSDLPGVAGEADIAPTGTINAPSGGMAMFDPFLTSDAPYQVRYAANLSAGDSYFDIQNVGANGDPLLGPGILSGLTTVTGNLCVNVIRSTRMKS